MNKILSRFIGGLLGLSMVVGVGFTLNNNKAIEAKADAPEVLPDYVLANKIYVGRDGYYLSGDGTNFAYFYGRPADLLFSNSPSKFFNVTFGRPSTNYYVKMTYDDYNFDLRDTGSDKVVVGEAVGYSSNWDITNNATGYYLVSKLNNSVNLNKYIGISDNRTFGRFYAQTADYFRDNPPIYIYEKSSTAVAYAFAEEFNKRLGTTDSGYGEGICKTDGSTNLDDLNNAWNGETVGDVKSLQTIYSEYRESLSAAQKNELDSLISSTKPKASGDPLQKALALYDHIVRNRGLNDFINSYRNPASLVNPGLSNVTNDTNNIIKIVIISSISIVALVSFFIVRRKKEQ